ncbi:hypothetical protein I4F81_001804 [Pyropia yezoensis]|uniref:Uncharacterized protein n=1 Tax=Pyropia yezoensis TaxID=2788 RepID=A0ACC3BN04_PYRYE|nr:hypothetical protein I4F81_001804 [Neopyropia yezoensis]
MVGAPGGGGEGVAGGRHGGGGGGAAATHPPEVIPYPDGGRLAAGARHFGRCRRAASRVVEKRASPPRRPRCRPRRRPSGGTGNRSSPTAHCRRGPPAWGAV